MTRYRKKPVVVDAWQIGSSELWPEWLKEAVRCSVLRECGSWWWVKTLEGPLFGGMGDYIIKGIEGELYPCKPDIFRQTYEVVEAEPTQHTHCCPCGAQRTCRLEGGYGDAGGKVGKVCSECKTTVEFHWREPPSFCPNCGAKVGK